MILPNNDLPFEVLIDAGNPNGADWPDHKLVHPQDAVLWIATGRFYSGPEFPVRSWWQFCDYDASEMEREEGRLELAEEMLGHAIETGRIRIAQVDNLGTRVEGLNFRANRLVALDFEKLSNWRFHLSSDDGLALYLTPPKEDGSPWSEEWDDDADYFVLEEFLLFWEDLSCLRKHTRPLSITVSDSSLQSLRRANLTSETAVGRSMPPQAQTMSERRGRRPHPNGAAIARFLHRVIAFGIEAATAEKNEELGRWLLEEYNHVVPGKGPSLRNASSDARDALDAWIAGMAQKSEE
ncbi:hypothetical protein HNO88_001604 [Novosphingobium chloroacetimidivorans]|uniref:Uncharacterized protein n=1 Tax=Novosphingobium chloroacetimidivorans TaxID=1428314 RepID=A0A7W7K967_9SPHN|nr:hypothetical protein [Novosphingobium chloroacetimidivorans]MBB4858285.1 hypothetical protein [Novosphingobium chloroacetimidivorans]